MNHITKNIIRIRTEKGIKQSEICRQLGIHQSGYSRLENRGEEMTIKQLQTLADILGVTLFELLIDSQDSPIRALSAQNKELRNKLDAIRSILN